LKYFTVLNKQNALSLDQSWLLTIYLILVASSHHIKNPSDGTSVFITFNLVHVKTESYINHVLWVEKRSKTVPHLGFS